MIKYFLFLLLLTIPFVGHTEDKYFPYLFKYNPDSSKVLPCYLDPVNEEEVRACIFWYELWLWQCLYLDAVEVRTDYMLTSDIYFLHNLSEIDVEEACNAALEAWNSLLDKDDELIFKINNTKPYTESIWIFPVQYDWKDYLDSSQVKSPAVSYICYDEMGWPDENEYENYSPYCITYSKSNDEYTAIILNASDEGREFFNYINGEPNFYAYPMEVDIQHIVMHELGHILGFGDDTDPNDNIETIMSHGSYWNRIVEQELRNTFEIMYNVECTSPGLPRKEQINEK